MDCLLSFLDIVEEEGLQQNKSSFSGHLVVA